MKFWILILGLLAQTAFADTPPPGTVKVKGGTDGTVIGNVGDSLKVSATIGLPTNAAQETGGHLASVDTKLSTLNTTLGSPFQAGGSIGNTSFGISGSLPAFASTPTFNLGTLNGAATATNQATLITDFNTLLTNLGSPFQAGGSIGNTSFGISGTLPAFAATPTFNLGTLNGAATATNQLTQIASLTSIDNKLTSPITVTQAALPAATGRTSIALVRNVYSSTNVTTSAYVQLIASTSDTINYLDVFDSSGQTLVLAIGGSGSEVNKFYIVPGGNGPVPLLIPAGSRVSIQAVSATANSGELDITGYK